ncbi:hypothetical protein EV07_0918 [Prochlorococcus sp. MIT 0603]|nr:hypothetical protein EV07_0918 [Prochlorococcus sp. MIT 0603]
MRKFGFNKKRVFSKRRLFFYPEFINCLLMEVINVLQK